MSIKSQAVTMSRQGFQSKTAPPIYKVKHNEFVDDVKSNRVENVVIYPSKSKVLYQTKQGETFESDVLLTSSVVDEIQRHDIDMIVDQSQDVDLVGVVLGLLFPGLLLFSILRGFVTQGRMRNMGEYEAKTIKDVSFKDVAGIDSIVAELNDIVLFLKEPSKFLQIGAQAPKGYLLCGPPGVGKTLVSKAIAAEANVPIFSCSGSDFVEMFVGLGASRVRDLFKKARNASPSIIYIDEIDAIGKKRSNSASFGNDEREQTLNQLLMEMDGFKKNDGVVVIASTNRKDILDPALIRPGRFDRSLYVTIPNSKERRSIVELYLGKVICDDDLIVDDIVDLSEGFSGADIKNLVNEAAILAVKRGSHVVASDDIIQAWENIVIGTKRGDMSESDRGIVAYHEAGHTLVGSFLAKDYDTFKVVSIVPRGEAGGVTIFTPTGQGELKTKTYFEGRVLTALGGRAAEEVIYGKDHVTTGASQDFKVATSIVYEMVTRFGFSDFMGVFSTADKEGAISEEYKAAVERYVAGYIDEAYEKCVEFLYSRKEDLEKVSEFLLENEVMDREQLMNLLE